MPETFHLDGKSHSVNPDDLLLIVGPGRWTGNFSGVIELRSGDTITMHMDNLAPGECVTITQGKLTTTFFRPLKKHTRRNIKITELA